MDWLDWFQKANGLHSLVIMGHEGWLDLREMKKKATVGKGLNGWGLWIELVILGKEAETTG